jgi:maltooligosyltrehalose trehalohydrolase
MVVARSYPIGAEIAQNGAHFRIWAPNAKNITLHIITKIERLSIIMTSEAGGYSSCFVPDVGPGALYQFQLDNDETLYPDPASRYQPLGPHGPSRLENINHFNWSDAHWQGVAQANNVIYEVHIGTFTQKGTLQAAADELPELAALGITLIELMPVNEFEGDFGWGYDGVALFAPYHGYGTPDDLRDFIDRAHALGMGVILDVVYNHVGASGCYLHKFSNDYFSVRYKSDWGDVFNFDGKNSQPVRELIITNAVYWIKEFHFDGFRLDATQQIFDSSDEHIISAVASAARAAAGNRKIYIVGENEPQQKKLVTSIQAKGYGLDSLWNDDFHHAARVALTGRTDAYYTDYKGKPQEFVASIKYGFLFQGQWYKWQKQRRGSASLDLPATRFVHYLQSHDQVANGGRGKRIHQLSHPALLRALTGLLLLGPQTPMLFQGQEFGASSPFLYFADNNVGMAEVVAKGRNQFLFQFPTLATPAMRSYLYRPEDISTFKQCKLNLDERQTNADIYQLHKELLHLRKTNPVLSGQELSHVDGAAISSTVFIIRYFSTVSNQDRLLVVNLGRDFLLSPVPEPLLAPHENHDWTLGWSSEYPQYGGHGACDVSTHDDWLMPGFSAALLTPVPLIESRVKETGHD